MRVLRRIEFHYTPKHGSWLNMAEIEFSVLTRQCMRRRLGGIETVARETGAWARARNAAQVSVEWLFSTEMARTKLERLYPSASAR